MVFSKTILPYLKLSKWILSLAVSLSGYVGFYIADTGNWLDAIQLMMGVLFLSAAASSMNQLQEMKTDALMDRTRTRPLISGIISKKQAIIFSICLIIIGSFLLASLSYIALALGWLNIVFYNLWYTPMKYKSHWAVLPGGVVGAIPPFMGWAAAGHSTFSMEIIIFAVFMFLWQIPHFWILLIKYQNDYNTAKIRNITEYLDSRSIYPIVIIWILTASMLTFTFPFIGIVETLSGAYILVFFNMAAVLLFLYTTFYKGSIKKISIANRFAQLYLVILFAVVLVEKMI